ncbi:hypothetical protein HHK36_010461 [Tetracentron sinense]|uniref:DNA 5'-3' helicase FANCJ n=1 Tax=Tetracentron sinense TaxID=13715 RepID=A0A834ZE20_TETSI|nr:hypothetical protein HHK36_010461 [Tetracentron sinense]
MSAKCNPSPNSATPGTNPNPNNPKNVYHIGGIPVEFPYKPYGSQLAFMGRVISTLDRAQRQGHCHALLESPTGTGKSLSLLCSTLAWQRNHRLKNLYTNLSHSKPAPEALSDPLAHGGGFVPEPEPSSNTISENLEPAPSVTNNQTQKQKTSPTIFYASRTHSQISQVIREYRKTSYRVPMAVLVVCSYRWSLFVCKSFQASRKHYCTNKSVSGNENIDEECKLLLKDRDIGCSEFKNVHKVKGHPSLQKGGCHEAHDIEDLVKVGRVVKGCSYYAARSMAEEAQLVFCPYSYVINPIIRRAMEVDLKGAIVILDEAHNIEDIARDAGSMDVEEDVLYKLQMELGQLCLADAMIYQPLYDMIQGLISWIDLRKSTLEKREFQHYFSCWTGDKALRELQEANISRQCFPILQECATKAIKAATDAESGGAHLSGMSVTTLEGLFSSLSYFFSGNGLHVLDYQFSLQRYVKRDAGHTAGGWTHSLSLWCLNPAVVFSDIANLSMSVILTSGTLSPMSSFSSELGVQFETCMEAPHVIDVESQLWAAVISTGPGNYPLNASYKTADGYAFQDALGASLEEICKVVPGGALVFFPSYKLMEKLCSRWRETGQWSRLNAQKPIFVEPRGNQDDFEAVLNGYYDSIQRGNRPFPGKYKRGKKRDLKHFDTKESLEGSSSGGAAFLAVCRGKVSEGIDFSDENARVVVSLIIVGIPFPNINDIQVAQKKKYNDTYKSSKGLLSGNQWYCNQAFRALNQAAGRCIRHRFDYGAIILLDERFREERNIAYVSKWLRKSIKQYDSLDRSLEGLQSFFRDIKERVSQKSMNVLENSDINEENIPPTKPKMLSKGTMEKKYKKINKLDDCYGRKFVSNNMFATEKVGHSSHSLSSLRKDDDTRPQLKSQAFIEAEPLMLTEEKDTSSCKEYIDLECDIQIDSRSSEAISMASSNNSPEIFVKETPGMSDNVTITSPRVVSKDENSSSTIVQATYSSRTLSKGTSSLAVTPERNVTADICYPKPELESSLNLSVNSHTQKRRKPMGSPLVDLIKVDQFGTPDAKSPCHVNCMRSMKASRDANRRIEFGFEATCPECKFKKPNVPRMLTVNNCGASCASSDLVMDKKLHICCSVCKNPLGLPENHLLVACSLTSSSKVYLISLLKSGMESLSINRSASVPVLISDISSVGQQLYTRINLDGAMEQGIWCKEDGCVFSTVFCPFCTFPDNLLGLWIMATDASNLHLVNKILFYLDRLEIKNLEAPKEKDSLQVSGSDQGEVEVEVLNSFDKFSYFPLQQKSEGWRTTKSKLKLPKKDLPSNVED